MMPAIQIFNPADMNTPKSPYLQVARAKLGEIAFIAGQVAVDPNGDLVGENDFDAQCALVFDNIHKGLKSIGAGWSNVVEFTSYLVRREDTLKFTAYRKREYPKMFKDGAYPPNTLLIINGLAHPSYLIEVQTIAVL
jgi:enamine deaminase RidA (YjgF/YER057c/UK114 family)